MDHRRSTLIPALMILLLCAALVSCVKTMGSGLVPPERDQGYGQWEIVSTGLEIIPTVSGEPDWQWQIQARFKPEQSETGLVPLDISATVDGNLVPFIFKPEGQMLESVTVSPLSSGTHSFQITPSRKDQKDFPTLTVEFEAP